MLTFTILSCLFFSLVHALPTTMMHQRDVVDPPITSPTASTVWHSGDKVTVTWDTSNINASQLTNPNGMLVLGWMASPTDSEHLMLDPPLAKNFPLIGGNVSFTVPSVVTRTNYIVVLFGDSGNISPTFTIDGTDSSSSSSAHPTTSTATTPTTSSTSAVAVSPSVSTSATGGSPPASPSSEVSVTSTQTSVITESPSTTASIVSISTATSSGVASISNSGSVAASGSSSSASTSASAQAASSNSAASLTKVGTQNRQVLAFVAASLLAAYLL